MENVTLCLCGCGEPAVYAARHVHHRPLERIGSAHYEIADRGHATPCWLFKNPRKQREDRYYNALTFRGRRVPAHRAMYEQEVGPIPDGLVIDHLCRQPRCIRPEHLEAVTQAENARRMWFTRSRELSLEEIALIRSSPTDYGTGRALARRFGVHEALISQIRSGRIYRED